ncbi:unnamed protein product, partial [Rotaria sp. Silwood2]
VILSAIIVDAPFFSFLALPTLLLSNNACVLLSSVTNADEIFASQQLFEILKTFIDSCFNELHTYQSLNFPDDYDEVTDEEDSADEKESIDEEEHIDDYDENQYLGIQNNFTLEEMENIVEWVDQHPTYKFASIRQRFRKVKYMHYITRYREYIKTNGTRLEKVKKIKEFMWNEFYVKRAIEKEAIHDSDLELFAIQKARELDWDNFKASDSFIKLFKKEYRISSRRYNKLITRVSSTRNICSLQGMSNFYFRFEFIF